MPPNPDDDLINTGELLRELGESKAQREAEYRRGILDALHEIRDSLAYLESRERERQKAETPEEPQRQKAETPEEPQS